VSSDRFVRGSIVRSVKCQLIGLSGVNFQDCEVSIDRFAIMSISRLLNYVCHRPEEGHSSGRPFKRQKSIDARHIEAAVLRKALTMLARKSI
jgi:hypothetical protein